MLPPIVASALLLSVAALHLLWSTGSHWPARSEAELAHSATGFPGADTMPPRWASLAVGVALLTACHVVLVNAGVMPPIGPIWVYRIAIWGVVAVFAARGLATFTPQWRARTSVQPFATLDRRYYGPLCLLLAGLCGLTAL